MVCVVQENSSLERKYGCFSRLKVQKLRDQSEESIRSGYGVDTHWVRSYWPGILMGHTHVVRSAYGVGTDCRGVGVTILVQIDVESIFRGVFL